MIVGYHKTGDDEPIAVCPYCYSCRRGDFQIEDYVTKPMLWCSECGARCVTSLTMPSHNMSTASPQLPTVGEWRFVLMRCPLATVKSKDLNLEHYLFYCVSLLKIMRVMNAELSEFTADRSLSQGWIRDFVEGGYNEEFGLMLGIKKRTGKYPAYEDEDTEVDMSLSLDCRSYNAALPKNPYPSNYELRHDGVYVNLECRKLPRDYQSCSDIIRVCYWGD